MRILALDTATQACSTALWSNGVEISREIETDRAHAQLILSMIDAVLMEGRTSLQALDALAFGRGPGAFTGVRLAASVAQGLAFGAGLPVVPISDLSAVAQRALDLDPRIDHLLVCNDARMQEVYWACFDRDGDGLASLAGSEHVSGVGRIELPAHWSGELGGAGRGFRVYPQLRAGVAAKRFWQHVHDELLPRAAEIARLAVAERARWPLTVDPAQEAIPVYVRDNVTRASRN